MTAQALLAVNPEPTRADVKAWMAGSLCRCTGYYKIIDAVLDGAGRVGVGPVPTRGRA
jgi:aerobic-type carbon monoxide dehydrogenase small subunit (CoxS/CutS family)